MRIILSLALLVLSTNGVLAQDAPAKDEITVLFIGNSFTYYHDLPKMLAELAKAGKQPMLIHERETPGGCTLEKHWKDGKALAKIQSRKWDFVVLQDHSQAALLKRDSMFDYGKKLDTEIKKQGAKTILYMTWALQNKLEDQPAITTAYLDLSKELKAKVAPVGNAWEAAIKADGKLGLHEKDKKPGLCRSSPGRWSRRRANEMRQVTPAEAIRVPSLLAQSAEPGFRSLRSVRPSACGIEPHSSHGPGRPPGPGIAPCVDPPRVAHCRCPGSWDSPSVVNVVRELTLIQESPQVQKSSSVG
jgi:hypothetical protein